MRKRRVKREQRIHWEEERENRITMRREEEGERERVRERERNCVVREGKEIEEWKEFGFGVRE